MIKVTLILGAIFVLCSAAVINVKDERGNLVKGCKSESELWGSADGTKFYFCIGDDMAIEQSCDPGTFFVKNATVSGCVPLDEVDDNCVYHVEPPVCEGEALKRPRPHEDPTLFYLCTAEGAEPAVLSCFDEQAFVDQNGYLGCFDWSIWRKIRECEDTD